MAEMGVLAYIIQVAGAGFRLALVLNAVGTEVALAGIEIHSISKGITLFSLVLKQVGNTLKLENSIHSQEALDTAREIAKQSELVFEEIKEMLAKVQPYDSEGRRIPVNLASRVKWCFKKHKVSYLLGQLESLKLSLSMMLQILDLAAVIEVSSRKYENELDREDEIVQERAEVQNMIIVRHWSVVRLKRLYHQAKDEQEESQTPPVYDAADNSNSIPLPVGGDSFNGVAPVKTVVRFTEPKVLASIDATMHDHEKPSDILTMSSTFVDMLLREWTRLQNLPPPPSGMNENPLSKPVYEYVESDDEEDSGEYTLYSPKARGHYIEGSETNQSVTSLQNSRLKAVHFPRDPRYQPSVESDADEYDDRPRGKRPPSNRYVIETDAEAVEAASWSGSQNSDNKPKPPRSPRSARRFSGTEQAQSRPRGFAPDNKLYNSNYHPPLGGKPVIPPSPTQTRGVPIPPRRLGPQHAYSSPTVPRYSPGYPTPQSGLTPPSSPYGKPPTPIQGTPPVSQYPNPLPQHSRQHPPPHPFSRSSNPLAPPTSSERERSPSKHRDRDRDRDRERRKSSGRSSKSQSGTVTKGLLGGLGAWSVFEILEELGNI